MRLRDIRCEDSALEDLRRKMAAIYDSRPCDMQHADDCSQADEAECPLRKAVDCPKRLATTSAAEIERRRVARHERELADARRCRIPINLHGIIGVAAAVPYLRDTVAVQECRRHRKGILVLTGPTGTGKTAAAAWWAWDHRGLFYRAEEVQALDWFDARDVSAVVEAPHLVLDDLGAEYCDTKGNWQSHLDTLINRRYDAALPTVITTNLGRDALRVLLGDRAWRRIGETGKLFACAETVDAQSQPLCLPGVEA